MAASFTVELIYDICIGTLVPVRVHPGVFLKPPDFADLDAFDLSYFAQHPRFALFVITALAIATLAGFALLSVRVVAFRRASSRG